MLLFYGTILVFQLLIDELKQKGLKTKKYIVESVILGILMGISTIFGINTFLWLIVIFSTLFITSNLDRTHISFPKKVMTSINQQNRENLYKIERININKLLVSIIICSMILVIINFTFGNILIKNNEVISNIIQNSDKIGTFSFDSIKHNLISCVKQFIICAPMLYMVIFIYILFMELLAFCLHRRYDTKSTLMKIIFLSLFIFIAMFNLNIYYFQPLLTIMLILIAIVNTSNIYLNREERIKMLVA